MLEPFKRFGKTNLPSLQRVLAMILTCFFLQRIYDCPESTGLVSRENQRRGRLPSLKISILWALEIINGFWSIKNLPIYGPKSSTSQDLKNIPNCMNIAHYTLHILNYTLHNALDVIYHRKSRSMPY